METETPKLSPAEYWEWRTTISEMYEANLKGRLADAELKLLNRDAELAQARIRMYQLSSVQQAKQGIQTAKEEYERYKGVLEARLGFSLNEKLIDDVTFEVKDLPKEPNTIKE